MPPLAARLLAFCLFLLAVPLWAQLDQGVVTGVVTDSSGALVPGARVQAVNQETNETWSGVTSEAGTYTVGPMRVGTYRISVEHEGFKRASREGVPLHAQDRARVDVRLELGQVSETVAVTAEAVLLQAESSTLAQVVAEREIRQLPLNGRNFQQLAWLTAGVMPATRSRDREAGFNAHGQPMTQNSFLIDGIDNNNNVMGMQDRKSQVIVPSLDAVAEFKVQTSNYSAEFGRNSGAVMIVNIKSGTNQIHGSAYEYLRNDRFDARDPFSYVDRTGDGRADPEVLRQNQFGATVGGPLRRDRTFYFLSWEQRQERRAQSDLATVPTEAERAGRFDARLGAIRDPLTGQAFPGNAIPRDRFDTTAAKLVELWPQANFGGTGTRQNFIRNPPWRTSRDQADARVDHTWSANDRMFGRFSLGRYDNEREGVFPTPARGGQGNDRALDDDDARSVAVSHTHILTPTLLNEFRYGFNRQKVNKRELSSELLSDLTSRYGIAGVPGSDRLFGLPLFTFGGALGYTGLGEPGSVPNFKISQVHQYLDNLSWNRGSHNVKFGADVRWNRSDIFGGASSHGNLTFDGQFTGNSFADFLLGMPSSANLTTLLIGNMRFRNYMLYALDDWKVTPRLTLNLGVRYELTTPWIDKHDNMNKLELAPGASFGQIVTAGECGSSYACRGLVSYDKNNWAPRVGLAYQPFRRTVLRAGAGVFYGGQGALGADSRMISNFPFSRSATLQSTATRPALPLSQGFPADFLAGTTPPVNLNWSVWEENFPLPTIYQWNGALQQELTAGLALTLAYVGSSSNYLLSSYNWNGALPGNPATERQRRPLPQWNTITLYTPYGHASYHGLDAQIERRYADGLSLTASYTWGHSIDNIPEQFGTGGNGLQDLRSFDSNRGNSNFDVRHRFVGGVVYELPVGRGRRWLSRGGALDALLGGWQVSGIVSAQSGNTFTVVVPNARQRLGATTVAQWWPDRVSDPRVDSPNADRWFDTAAFALPRNADGTWRLGNAGRNILATDGLFNVDGGLMKTFKATERVAVQVRGEVFNATNTPTLGEPVTNVESPDFGKVRSTFSTPRQMQFALRLTF